MEVMETDKNVLIHDSTQKLENATKSSTIYFGVHIPNDNNNGPLHVFDDKEDALRIAKKHKKSRFKSFQFYHEAVEFSVNGADNCNSLNDIPDVEKKELVSSIGEKASPFRTPRPQELTEFRSKIEFGNISWIRDMIELNPRYLVSSGDTPSILQEGARLNALHVASKVKNEEIVELILSTVSNPEFIKKLYGDDSQENAEQRCKMLLDLYLNTPNKGFNDTPLHIASKWGADSVIEVLLSYPECDRTRRNKHGKLPEEVICERADGSVTKESKIKIQQLLCDNYYVPVLRTDDNTMPPSVGEPFSPKSPPVLKRDPLSPKYEIYAYAGPMDRTDAESFRKVWKTPPRTSNFNSPNVKKTPIDNLAMLRLKDPEKGLERIGKTLANNFNVGWREYWEFLDCFMDIASDDGLKMLEEHLQNKRKSLQDSFEVFSPLVSKPEYIVSPITNLCNAFAACKLDDSQQTIDETDNAIDQKQTCHPLVYVDKACQVFSNRIIANVLNLLQCSECDYENPTKSLETDIKLLELLMNSYMEDERFADWINFQRVHSRLADYVAKKLCESKKGCNNLNIIKKIEDILECMVKKSDYFSSDDEGPTSNESSIKPTVYRKQVVCLLSRVKCYLEIPTLNDENNTSVNSWKCFDVCNCVFHHKRTKKNLSRNGSLKRTGNRSKKNDLQRVSKKLQFEDNLITTNSLMGTSGDLGFGVSDSSKSDTDEDYVTPPDSPTKISSSSDSEESFSDAMTPMVDLFLEGTQPTKTDSTVFDALRYSECHIDKFRFPLVYKWHHTISLYKAQEREKWRSPYHEEKVKEPSRCPDTFLSPKPSRTRIIGADSPRDSPRR